MSDETKDTTAQKEKLSYYKALNDIANQIHSARDMDEIFLNLNSQILSLFNTERISIYVIDHKRKELYQRLKAGGATPKEIRVPINNESIAGYTANNAQVTNILNAYDGHELSMINRALTFDRSWDEKNSFRTKQVLTVPIFFKNTIIGVLQLINKNNGDRFTLEDQNSAIEMAKVLGIAFYNQIKLVQKTRKKTRFDYLINNSLITEKELEQAIIMAREQKVSIETVFINDFKVKKNDIGKSLGEFYGCDYVPYDSNFPIPGDLLARLKHVYLKNNLWVPLSREGGRVKILIDNPQRLDKVDSIKSLIQAATYEFCVGLRDDIIRFLDYFYGTPQVVESDSIHDIMAKLDTDAVDADDDSTEMMTEDDSAIVQLVNKIITDGYKKNASDIHVEPYPGKSGAEIRFRVDGSCAKYQTIPYHYKRAIVSRIKIMSELDISERRKPQDGKIKFKKFASLDIELRVATIPTVGGEEDVVMRILAAGEPIPLDAMGFSERNYKLFTHLISQPYGIVLVVGPTGSGKTTTLHAALHYINKPDTKIWTAEDPVEITQKGLRQVQVLPKIGFDFAAAMRSFLRADPDVIMVGEMRDHETVSTGIEASLTGHLVFSTLHTNSAPETITRLLDMGMDSFNFADAILGILAQRLVRTLCKACKEPYHPDKKEYDDLVRAYAGDFDALGTAYTDDLKLYRAKGCEKCNNTGYKGRTGIIELLDGTDRMRNLIQEKAKMEALREQAIKDGMTTLMQDGIRKVFLGLTDIQQVRKVCVK
ncbi:MAG: Flp pilus assembly complex ATPase component TadA [Desulfatiglans sp.]|jgi:type II secretory ATPase GspE/PulE/Tfp pilus assembly ATPase PilB-like protein|nr:Flp pilus assembly complex ATPase component TadA [Desulfatiglans sp.]